MTNEQKAKDYCSKHYLREGYATRGSFEKAMIAMVKWKDKQFTEKKKEMLTIVETLPVTENNQTTIEQLMTILKQ